MLLSEILKKNAKVLRITGKVSLNRFYNDATQAIKDKKLNRSGMGEFSTLNGLVKAAGLKKGFAKSGNEDVIDWDIKDDEALKSFLDSRKVVGPTHVAGPYVPSATTAPLHKAITEAAEVARKSNAGHAEVVAALKNLVDVYALSMNLMRLPKLSDYPMPTKLPAGYELGSGATIAKNAAGNVIGIAKV